MEQIDLMDIRAAVTQIVKAQERELDGYKKILAIIDKSLGLRPVTETHIPNASIAGAVGNVVTRT